ncbi:DUF3943 domain-containing protein [Bdellovibrionota bacterium FG-2]
MFYIKNAAILAFFGFFSILARAGSPDVSGPGNRFLLSIDEQEEVVSVSQIQKRCADLYKAIAQARKILPETQCALSGTASEKEAQSKGIFKYRFDRKKRSDGTVVFAVENISVLRDPSDITRLEWLIAPGSEDSQSLAIQKLMVNFFEYDSHDRLAKEILLAQGVRNSQRIVLNEEGEYVDRLSGQVVEFAFAYSLFQQENFKQRNYLRAGIELLAFLGAGSIWYWSDSDLNTPDWDLDWNWESWRKKLTLDPGGVSFDNNAFETNAFEHAKSGTAFYLTGRSNNLNILESFLFSVAAATVWEYFGEFREKVSINDVILTPVAGMAIGEVFSQLGAFFERSDGNLVTKTLGMIFGTQHRFHNWVDSTYPTRSQNLDRFGFTNDIWHELKLELGMGREMVAGKLDSHFYEVTLGTELINVKDYGKPGQVKRILTDGNFSQLLIKGATGSEDWSSLTFFFKAALAGYYKQSIVEDKRGDLKGYSFFVGVASAYEHSTQTNNSGIDDKLGIVNVLGPTMELNYYHNGVQIRAKLDVFGDFALVRSYSYDRWLGKNGAQAAEELKSVLRNQKYYYAMGVTIRPQISAKYKHFELGAELQYDAFDSIEGEDRFQSKVTRDSNITDVREQLKFWVTYTFPAEWVKLKFSYERLMRKGAMEDVSERRFESVFMGSLVFLF